VWNIATVVSELDSAAEHLDAEDVTCGHIVIDSDVQVGRLIYLLYFHDICIIQLNCTLLKLLTNCCEVCHKIHLDYITTKITES